MKKKFENPTVEFVKLNPADIIVTSDINIGGEGDLDARSSGDWDFFGIEGDFE